MKTYPLTISSPDGDVFKGDVVSIRLRGVEGEFAILAGHVPFVTAVKPCTCVVELSDEIKEGKTEGGIITVAHDNVTFLTGSLEWNN